MLDRLYRQDPLVICRIGSLENFNVDGDGEIIVICRIGSLEIQATRI